MNALDGPSDSQGWTGDQPTIDDLPRREIADDLMAQSNLAAWISEAKRDAKTLSSDDMADVLVACMKRENWTLGRTRGA